MEIFRSVTQTVLGNQPTENQPNGAETVEKLIDRVQSSSLLEDRRDACRAIKSLVKKYRILVGAHGMDTLIQVLESDRNDHDIVNYALETLIIVTSTDPFEEDENDISEVNDPKVGEQFSEIFIKKEENISVVMTMLDEFDFKVCYPAMKLLANLLQNRPREVQEAILVLPNGISKLMDLLTDSREVIRNDVLLILTELSKGNANTQKIIVFENAYDHLFKIMKEEEYAEGGVVVEDCLILMWNLLKSNSSNQTLFKEGNYMQKITNFFSTPSETEIDWSKQRITNVHWMLEVIRSLVSPQNTVQIITDCQKKIHAYGILEALCSLLMRNGVPAEILTDTINTIADLIRGNKPNQQFFSTVTAPSTPPRPVIVVLLMSMVNDKQPFMIRCAVLYCFQCFLYRNTSGQAQIVQTLLPQENHAPQMTAGQLLCGGLFAQDSLSNWFCAIALSHTLLDNTAQKEQLLRAQLAPVGGSLPVSLLQQCVSLLQGGSKFQTRVSLLQLLCIWIAHCPVAVNQLLSIPSFVPYLTAFVSSNEHDEMEVICQGVCAFLLGLCAHFNDGSVASFNRESIASLVSNRVGVENFTDKLENILRTEANSRAAKSPHIRAKDSSQIVFDHEFTRLFKSLEVSALKSVTTATGGEEATSVELKKCKELIKQQNAEIEALKNTIQIQTNELQEVKQNNQMLSVKLTESQQNQVITNGTNQADLPTDIVQLQQQLSEMTYARDYYYYQMVEKDNLLQAQTQNAVPNGETVQDSAESPGMLNLRRQLEDLQLLLNQKDEEIRTLRDEGTSNLNSSDDAKVLDLRQHSITDETRLQESLKQYEQLNNELKLKISSLEASHTKLQGEYEALSSEQEDVLVLLTEQETKIGEYRKMLTDLGQQLSDEEDILDSNEDLT